MAMNAIGTLLILVVAVAVNLDIIGRDFFNAPIPGVTEFVGLSIVAIVFLQMANTLREDRHVANDLLIGWIAPRRPRFARLLQALYAAVGAVLMGFITWYVWPIVRDDYEGGFYRGTASIAEIPSWPFMAVVLVGAAVTGVQYAIIAWRELQRSVR